jgi:hypothetical protein
MEEAAGDGTLIIALHVQIAQDKLNEYGAGIN